MSGLFSKPEVPAPPPPDPNLIAAAESRKRKQIASARGRRDTILTPLTGGFPQGDTLLGGGDRIS